MYMYIYIYIYIHKGITELKMYISKYVQFVTRVTGRRKEGTGVQDS